MRARVQDIRGRRGLLAGAAAAAGLALAGWMLWLRPRALRLRLVELELPRWPRDLDGLTIAVLADLHAGGPHVGLDRIDEIVARTNAARADVVALLGDYLDPNVLGGEELPVAAVAERLAGLRAAHGVHAVLGNHDLAQGAARIERGLEAAGIPVLRGEAARLAGGRLALVGIREGERDPVREAGSIELPSTGAAAVVALCHNPDAFPGVPAEVALTISGHTHGGQVDLPIVNRLVIPSRHGTRFKAGHLVEDGRHLFVSQGIGNSRLPVRLAAAPELPLLRLRAAPASAAREGDS